MSARIRPISSPSEEELKQKKGSTAPFSKNSTDAKPVPLKDIKENIKQKTELQVTYTMLQAIRDYYDETGQMIGMKPAGGISNAKLALDNLVMVKEVLGQEWLDNKWFRFGASSLANDVLMQIMKTDSGIYQSGDYFTLD